MAYKKKEYIYNKSLSKEENLLLDRLYKLRLSHMAEALERQFLNPNMEPEGFLPRISSIINYEWDQRQTKKFNKLKTKATLKYPDAFLSIMTSFPYFINLFVFPAFQNCFDLRNQLFFLRNHIGIG